MKLESLYPARFFARRHKMAWRAPILCRAIQLVLRPMNVVDIGCAVGDIVAEFNRMNIPAMGMEGAKTAEPYLLCPPELVSFRDLRERLFFSEWFHLATCFEVAEHIEPEFADVFVENLVCLSNKILMSAAPPGQGGVGHFNCQPLEYWTEKFGYFGYMRNEMIEDNLKHLLEPWKSKPGIKAIHQNMVYYARI
jgi:hypothetical protein